MYQSKFEWHVREKTSQLDEALVTRFELNELERAILENRGFDDAAKLESIFNPEEHSADLVHDISAATQRIETAFTNGERILIYGDYDADGITSTAILYHALKKRAESVAYFIPNRVEHGYGPNMDIFTESVIGEFDLVITVDNGIGGAREMAFLEENGIDSIIVDHHAFGADVPQTTIIHPAHASGGYPYQYLAGVGITYKLIEALELSEPMYLGLVAIGTVADVVAMTGENKSLVIRGLEELNANPPLGVSSLMRTGSHSGIIDEETIGFTIAPRLNATGRIDEASAGVELLLSEDYNEAYEIATYIETLNQERKDMVATFYNEALEQIDETDALIVAYSADWHPGVVGIVASRLQDEFGKPAIVLSLDAEEDRYKGSGRSIEGVDLLSVITGHTTRYLKAGGHERAFGVEVDRGDITGFKAELDTYFKDEGLEFKPVKYIDYSVTRDNLTLKSFERFNRLKPFGEGFTTPLFMVSHAKIGSIKQVGKDKSHIKLTLEDVPLDVIGFNFGHLAHEVSARDDISLIGTISVNEFNRERKLQMVLTDVRIDQVQLVDMRSRATQDFSMISQDDHFIIADGDRRGDNYFYYGERLPFAMDTLILRDLPDDIGAMEASLENIHVSKIVMIFNSTEELYFSGIPTESIIGRVKDTIEKADDGAIDLAKHAPRFADSLGISMKMLKMATDILEDTRIIRLENGIVFRGAQFNDMDHPPFTESATMKQLFSRLDAESRLKMSSTNELKAFLKDMI